MSRPIPLAAFASRRDFLQAAGFTLVAAAAGCVRPPAQVLAPLEETAESPAGRRIEYATTCAGCGAGCGISASVRDGRPVKLEGLPSHPVSRGGLCAAGQAGLLGLYDSHRVLQPRVRGQPASWPVVDAGVGEALRQAASRGGAVRLLTGTVEAASPTLRATIGRFLARHPGSRHDVLDALSASALADAHRPAAGERGLPRFRFDRAEVVVSFDADFLGTWISPVEFTAMRSLARPRLHVQFESRMSLTGAKADRRVVVAPGELGAAMAALSGALWRRAGGAAQAPAPPSREIESLAEALWGARGRALVVCGDADARLQRHAAWMNEILDARAGAIEPDRDSRQRLGDEAAISRLADELERGEVGVLVIAGVNPVHERSDGARWRSLLERVPALVSVAERVDETSGLAHFHCPPPHALESWGDQEPVTGILGLRQPLWMPAGDTRSLAASLAAWTGAPADARELVRRHWQDSVYRPATDGASFEDFWEGALRRGWVERPARPRQGRPRGAGEPPARIPDEPRAPGTLDLVAYASPALLDGRHAYNPWLHELPDPFTKVTWESCASLSPARALALGVADGDIVRVAAASGANAGAIEVPVVIQPGQHDDAVAIPVGYGQELSRRFSALGPAWAGAATAAGAPVGANVAPLVAAGRAGVRVTPTGRRIELARTQIDVAPTTADALVPDFGLVRRVPAGGRARARPPRPAPKVDHARRALWTGEAAPAGPRWGMVIDLDACTGCGACVIACQAENNTPVVGRDEVRRHREMHWMRIDRHYREGERGIEVAHQPMTCHHCGHAPCESVCPVLATTRSGDGLNQQVYSRCVGTRYCSNNCPYKVRRFNWFDYARDDALANLALNPDVSVRSRGVAEKCTLCAHRIQDARLQARQAGHSLADGDVTTACAQSCPAGAIVFGDLNDASSRAARSSRDPRAYTLLDHLNLEPALSYLAIVEPAGDGGGGPKP